jgi:Family of unknown function (DUF6111)
VRQFFEIVLPLILPTIIYIGYFSVLRPRRGGSFPEMPWIWLGAAGLLLLAVTFLALALMGGAEPSAKYLPPKVVNGQIQPGHYEPTP